MSAGPQIAWDDQPKTPPQQVQWDEAPKQEPSFWQRVKNAVTWEPPGLRNAHVHSELPEGAGFTGISQVAGEAARSLEQKRDEAERANEANIAKGGKDFPMSSYRPSAFYDLAARGARMVSGLTSPGTQAIGLAGTIAPEIVGPALIAHGGYGTVKEAPAAFQGDPEATERMLSSAAEAVGGTTLTHGALTTKPTVKASLAESTTGKALRPVTDIATEAVSRLKTPEAQKTLTQAVQPGVRVPKAQESIAIAGPRIQQIRQASNVEIPAKGPEALKAVLDLNREAKTQILQAIEDRMGPVADLRPNANAVAKGIRGAVDDLTVEQTPGLRESMERRAGTYDREGGSNWTIRQMENRMHTLNNRLANAYTQVTPGEARISAETEMDLAEARELRKLIDESVEKLSGEGVKDLKREYGAQRDLEKGLARQYAVATRTKGAPLWEGLAYLQAAGDIMSGNVLGAARAAGRIMVGNRLQLLRDAGYLANQAFHGSKAFKAAPPIPAHQGPPAPAGLLPPPATEMGFPNVDTSGPVRGGRYTTPKALLPGEQPIEAEFIPRRVPTAPERVGINRMLPESTGAPNTTPPAVSPKFAQEAIGSVQNEQAVGARGEQGTRVPTFPPKGLLPGEGGISAPKPPAPTGGIKPEVAKKALQTAKGAKTPAPVKPVAQLEKLSAGKTPAYVEAAAKEAGAMPAGYQPGEQPGMGFFQFHDPELGGSFYIREGQVSTKAIKDAMEARRKTIEPSPLVTEKTENVKREVARREGKSENELLAAQAETNKGKLPPVQASVPAEDLAHAEGLLRAEVGMMQSMDRPGRYFDESTEESHVLTQNQKRGERAGGSWRGVKSGRGMMPFMREHPEVSPSKAADAIEKDGTNPTYQKLMRAALEFIKREKPAPRTETAPPAGVLPGMAEHVKAQEAGVGKVKAEGLTREMNTTRSIESAAGEMETKSPLFRGTAASLQNEMFGKQAISAAKKSVERRNLENRVIGDAVIDQLYGELRAAKTPEDRARIQRNIRDLEEQRR